MTRRLAILAAFFCHALAFGGLFTRLPDIAARLGAGEAALGLALLGAGAGGLLSLLVAPSVIARVGTRVSILVAIPTMAAFQWLSGIAPSVATMGGLLFLGGLFFSLANIAINVEANRIETEDGARIMNRCHGLWSLGVLGAALLGVVARGVAVPVGWHLFGMSMMAAGILVAALWPVAPAAVPEGDRAARTFSLPEPAVAPLVLFGVAGGFAQNAVQSWSVLFVEATYRLPPWVATLSLPAFLAMLTVGRLVSDAWMTRRGMARVVRVQLLTALLGVVLVVLPLPFPLALLGYGAMGFGTAAMFPSMVTAAARLGQRGAARAVASVVLATSLTMLAAPPLIGAVAEIAGFRAAFAVVALPVVLALLATSRLARADAAGLA